MPRAYRPGFLKPPSRGAVGHPTVSIGPSHSAAHFAFPGAPMKQRMTIGLGGLATAVAIGIFVAVQAGKADGNKGSEGAVTVSRGTVVDKALAVGQLEP